GAMSGNLIGSSPRITVLSLSFTIAGPPPVSTTSSCPVSDVILPFTFCLLCARSALFARKTAIAIIKAVQPVEGLSSMMQRLSIAPPVVAQCRFLTFHDELIAPQLGSAGQTTKTPGSAVSAPGSLGE